MKHLHDLLKHTAILSTQTIVVVNAADKTVIKSICKANEKTKIKSILIGDKKKIEEIIKEEGCLKDYQIVDETDDVMAAKIGVKLVKQGKGTILMKGLIDTKVFLKAVVDRQEGIRQEELLSHVTALSFPQIKRIIFITDCAMVISPTVEQKMKIIENLLLLTKKLNIKKPKIALISAVEKPNVNIPSSLDASILADYYRKVNAKDYLVDGPFAIDNVVSKEAALQKGIISEVAGCADALVFPHIDVGNVFYKTAVYIAGALAAGIVLGARVPIVLTSRADSSEIKFYSILLAGVYGNGL